MTNQCNKLTIADDNTEFLDKYNSVISDGSIPYGKDDNETDNEGKKYVYINM